MRGGDSVEPAVDRHKIGARYGGLKPRFNPGSNSGAGSEGGEGEYQHQEPGFNPGSTQVQPRLNPGSNPGSTQFEPTFNPGSNQVL